MSLRRRSTLRSSSSHQSSEGPPLEVPDGFPELMRALSREVIRHRPADIRAFALQYLTHLLQHRQETGEDPLFTGSKLQEPFMTSGQVSSSDVPPGNFETGSVRKSAGFSTLKKPSQTFSKKFSEQNADMQAAATKIQSGIKGFLTRKKIKEGKISLPEMNVRLQPRDSMKDLRNSGPASQTQKGIVDWQAKKKKKGLDTDVAQTKIEEDAEDNEDAEDLEGETTEYSPNEGRITDDVEEAETTEQSAVLTETGADTSHQETGGDTSHQETAATTDDVAKAEETDAFVDDIPVPCLEASFEAHNKAWEMRHRSSQNLIQKMGSMDNFRLSNSNPAIAMAPVIDFDHASKEYAATKIQAVFRGSLVRKKSSRASGSAGGRRGSFGQSLASRTSKEESMPPEDAKITTEVYSVPKDKPSKDDDSDKTLEFRVSLTAPFEDNSKAWKKEYNHSFSEMKEGALDEIRRSNSKNGLNSFPDIEFDNLTKDEAATKIQALFRGNSVRKMLERSSSQNTHQSDEEGEEEEEESEEENKISSERSGKKRVDKKKGMRETA